VVFTSATLANANGDSGVQSVEWMSGYSYLKSDKRFKKPLFLEAVFDYKKKSRVFLVSDFRSLTDPMFVTDLMDHLSSILRSLNGRALFLFSSRLRFDQGVDYLLRHLDKEIPIFVQGLGKNVIEEFKKSSHGILIGMESFGEGIDIPGEKLQFVIIDKIPDVRQDLVIQKRREFFEDKFGNEFHDYFLAHRSRSLHQKFGRLIRTETDHGVILVVDSRVKKWKTGTLLEFKKQMEPYDISIKTMTESLREIEEYFKA
jgi:ATP-dependent DNA helicase DinG